MSISNNNNHRIIIKMTYKLLDTYTGINNKYKLRKNHELQQLAKDNVDKDYNYVIKNSELLVSRYVVTPLSGKRTAVIGKGAFGIVVSAWDQKNKEFVAIKIVKKRPNFSSS